MSDQVSLVCNSFVFIQGWVNLNLFLVTDAMVRAMTSQYPKDRYFEASLPDLAIAYIYQFAPTFISDRIVLLMSQKWSSNGFHQWAKINFRSMTRIEDVISKWINE